MTQRSTSTYKFRIIRPTGRPDSLFGHVILDYKAPGVLKTTAGLRKAKEQVVEDYLNPACSRAEVFDPEEAEKWAGILLDGRNVTFVTFNGVDAWDWSPLRDVNEFTVATLLQYYRALYRKPLDPRSLSTRFWSQTRTSPSAASKFSRAISNTRVREQQCCSKSGSECSNRSPRMNSNSFRAWKNGLNSSTLAFHDDASLSLYCLHTYTP